MAQYDLRERVTLLLSDMPAAVRNGYIHPTYRHHNPFLPDDEHAPENGGDAYLKGYFEARAHFPDQRSEPIWLLRDGDMTACRWRVSGTFSGAPIGDLPPHGGPGVFEGMTIYRWLEGQVIEGMSMFDQPAFERQIRGEPR